MELNIVLVWQTYEGGQSCCRQGLCYSNGPFQVNPTSINFDLLEDGEYQESSFQLQTMIVLTLNSYQFD